MDKPRIKILFLIPTLGTGGAERVVLNLLRNMDRDKFDLSLAILNVDTAVFLDDVPKDINFVVIGSSRVRYAVVKIVKLIKELKPDIAFSTLGHLNLMLAMVRQFLPKSISFIGRSDTILSLSIQENSCPQIWKWAYRMFYHNFDRIICQSRYMKEDLAKNFGISPQKMGVINNPVDIERVRQMAEEPVAEDSFNFRNKGKLVNLVTVGRLASSKGFDLIIEALSLSEKNRFHLSILGDGEEEEGLKALVESLGVAGQVSFLGFKKNPYAYIGKADAYVLGSRHEGFPNVVLESLACATPVIATPAPGGTVEILEGLEGCMITEEISAAALAKAFDTFVFGKRLSPDLVQPYALKKIVDIYQQQFLQLVSEKG